MKLQLKRPLCVFDLETTGIQITKDRIVQIAIIKINPDGSELEYNEIVNPEMEIPQEICEIHYYHGYLIQADILFVKKNFYKNINFDLDLLKSLY